MIGRALRALLGVVVVSSAVAAGASPPRLAFGPIYGPARAALVEQLRRETCAPGDCVPWPQVTTGEWPDPAKARRHGVTVAVTGVVSVLQGQAGLSLSIFSGPRLGRRIVRLPLDRGGVLPAATLARARREIAVALEATQGAIPPAPTPPPAAPAPAADLAPPPAPLPLLMAQELVPFTPAPTRPDAGPPPPIGPASTGTPPADRRSWLAFHLGGLGASRHLRFTDAPAVQPPPLEFTAPSVAGAHGRLELSPLAPFADGAWAGLGLFAAVDRAISLRTDTAGLGLRPTDLQRLSLGATWATPALGALRVILAPELSWEQWTLAVRPAVPGLPDADLGGVRAGLGGEATLLPRLGVVAGAGAVRWTRLGALIGPGYFKGGSAWGLEARAGLQLALSWSLAVRLEGEWRSTRYELDPEPAGAWSAKAATDQLLVARLSVRARL